MGEGVHIYDKILAENPTHDQEIDNSEHQQTNWIV